MAKAARRSPKGRVVHIERWEQYLEYMQDRRAFSGWAFRGQAMANWPLDSALARYLRDFGVHPDAWPVQEQRILRIFKRKAHLFLSHVPGWDDDFQWLALMQHHGAPTRLVDFTWSPYVAAFFALEQATEDAVVWAVKPDRIMRPQRLGGRRIDPRKMNPRERGKYAEYFVPNRYSMVWIGEPLIMNRRLIAQGGTFMVPGTLQRPIDQLLGEYPAGSVVKFVFDAHRLRSKAMWSLYTMNITHASLFPDLDGLARSLAYELEYHWAYDPRSLERYAGEIEGM